MSFETKCNSVINVSGNRLFSNKCVKPRFKAPSALIQRWSRFLRTMNRNFPCCKYTVTTRWRTLFTTYPPRRWMGLQGSLGTPAPASSLWGAYSLYRITQWTAGERECKWLVCSCSCSRPWKQIKCRREKRKSWSDGEEGRISSSARFTGEHGMDKRHQQTRLVFLNLLV